MPLAIGRKLATALALTALLVAGGAAPAAAQGGLAAGLNFNALGDIDTGGAEAVFESSTGWHAGAFYRVGLGPVALEPGVFYHQVGRYDFADGSSFELRSVEVPVDVQVSVLPLPGVGAYVLAAPVLTVAQPDDDFEEAVEDLSLTADVGVGLDVSLPGTGLTLQPELRYSTGVTDYLDESFQVGGTTIEPADEDRRLSKVMLRVGVTF